MKQVSSPNASPKLEVGFIGLGVMGSAMAGHILRGGHDLTVYNRTIEKTEAFKREGARVANSPRELAQNCNLIFICAADGPSVMDIIFGKPKEADVSLSAGLRPGAVIVDHSTIAPNEAIDLAKRLAEVGFKFLDAPVTGGDIGAKNGTLTTMVGGDSEALESVRPVLELYSKKISRIGQSGCGQKMKAVNQIGAIGGTMLAAELLKFAEAQGLDLSLTIETLKDGAAGSFALLNYGPKMAAGNFEPGFSVKHSKKDVGIVLRQASGLELPIMKEALKELTEAENKGWSEMGTQVLFKVKGDA